MKDGEELLEKPKHPLQIDHPEAQEVEMMVVSTSNVLTSQEIWKNRKAVALVVAMASVVAEASVVKVASLVPSEEVPHVRNQLKVEHSPEETSPRRLKKRPMRHQRDQQETSLTVAQQVENLEPVSDSEILTLLEAEVESDFNI